MVGVGGGEGNPHPRSRIRSQDERKNYDIPIHLGMSNSGTFQKKERRGLESEVQSRRTPLQPLSSPRVSPVPTVPPWVPGAISASLSVTSFFAESARVGVPSFESE